MSQKIQKFIASSSQYSRRRAEELVAEGKILVNGRPATIGQVIEGAERVEIKGGPIIKPRLDKPVVYALYKPKGVVSTASNREKRRTVVDLVKSEVRLFPVGRLDIDSTGLMILTNDGQLMQQLTHPKFEIPKTYLVQTVRNIVPAQLERLATSIQVGEETYRVIKAIKKADRQLELTIAEGKHHEIKRLMEALQNSVVALKRTRIGSLTLASLKLHPGQTKLLSDDQVKQLQN